MTDPDLTRLFIEPLERLGVTYMITGGVAAVIYGDPRFTRDVDVVLALAVADARRLEYFDVSGSDRHLRDVSVMLRISRDLLDGSAFDYWTGRLGLGVALERARAYRTDL